MTRIPKGERRGFLEATGRERVSPSGHIVYEFNCLACGLGTTWKRYSDKSGLSCGCLKRARFAIWVSCFLERLPYNETLAKYKVRHAAFMEEVTAALQAKEKGQQETDTASAVMEVDTVSVDTPPTADPKAEAPKKEKKPRKKPTKPRVKKSKLPVAETPSEEHPVENPTNSVDSPTVETSEPLSE